MNSLTATWVAPTTGGGTKYTVTLKEGSTTKDTNNDVSGTTTTFSSLTAGNEYTIVVVSVIGDVNSGGQTSDSVENKFYTSKSEWANHITAVSNCQLVLVLFLVNICVNYIS